MCRSLSKNDFWRHSGLMVAISGLICLVLCLGAPAALVAQEGSPEPYVVIDSIDIKGQKKTRVRIIKRELSFALGDTLSVTELSERLETSRQQLINTGLFAEATVKVQDWDAATNELVIAVHLTEGWYIYPVPVFELADRNFNVWWVDQNRSLERVNIGLEFAHTNFTGNNDKLKIKGKFGYTRSVAASYTRPFINRQQTIGLIGGGFFSQRQEINYATEENRQLFYRAEDNRFLTQKFRLELGTNYRPALRTVHAFLALYHQNRIDPFVATDLNPDYFLDGRSKQEYLGLLYRLDIDQRDSRFYAWDGYYLRFEAEKNGLGIFNDRSGLHVKGEYVQYVPFGKAWSLRLSTQAKYSIIRSQQPFNDNRALGYRRTTLKGYAFYVVDGLDMLMATQSLRYRVFKTKVNFGRLMPLKSFRVMPLQLAVAFNSDWGYVNGPYQAADNPFVNRSLYGFGVGLDMLFFYDKVFKVEYSVNHLKESGIFLQIEANI